jgi:uncharacterized protein DUF6526
MADTDTQSYSNHARFVPLFHFVAGPILIANFVTALIRLVRSPAVDTLMAALVALALVLMGFYARAFALAVQDRVIRLEMRQRMKELLPADLQGRIGDFTPRQLVALRFAGDSELPDLCRTVLTDKITDGRSIKKMIKNWQGDYLRA